MKGRVQIFTSTGSLSGTCRKIEKGICKFIGGGWWLECKMWMYIFVAGLRNTWELFFAAKAVATKPQHSVRCGILIVSLARSVVDSRCVYFHFDPATFQCLSPLFKVKRSNLHWTCLNYVSDGLLAHIVVKISSLIMLTNTQTRQAHPSARPQLD